MSNLKDNLTNIYLNTSQAVNNVYDVSLSAAVSMTIVATIAAIVNIVILCLSVQQKELMKKDHVILVLMLCVSDVLVGISGMTLALNFIFKNLSSNRDLCSFQIILLISGISSSVAQLFVISLHSFLSTTTHTLLHILFKGSRKFIVVNCMIIAIFIMTVSSRALQEEHIESCSTSTLYKTNINIFRGTFAWFCIVVTSFIIVLNMITIVRVKRFYKIRPIGANISYQVATQKITVTEGQQQQQEQKIKKFRKSLITIVILIALLTITTLPFVFFNILESLEIDYPIQYQRMSGIAVIANSLTNPIVYVVRFAEVRQMLFLKCFK